MLNGRLCQVQHSSASGGQPSEDRNWLISSSSDSDETPSLSEAQQQQQQPPLDDHEQPSASEASSEKLASQAERPASESLIQVGTLFPACS